MVMKSYTDYLWFEIAERRDLVNITDEVSQRVRRSGIGEWFCLVSAMHITAGIWVNDDEPGLRQDFWELLDTLAPYGRDYQHHQTGEDNGDAHLKRTLIHHQVLLPVTDGKLDMGPWEQVFYAEFDGRRRKRVVIKIIGE
jgi:secondary thiamine-phosphate synthase enzyme